MAYNYLALVKQVPDTANITGDVMKPDGTVNRAKLPAIFNPEDKVALELALQMRDRFGGKVTAITMGPPKASELLRECLYMGVDEVHLISDRKFAGADTLATSYVLSEAIKHLGKYDVMFAGRQAIDGDTAQVGPQAADKLKIPQVTYVEEVIDAKGKKITVKRKIEGGFEILESAMPVMLTVLEEAAFPRPFTAKKLMANKNAKTFAEIEQEVGADAYSNQIEESKDNYVAKNLFIPTLSLEDLGLAPERCGHSGSPTKVFKIVSVVLEAGDHETIEPTPEGMEGLVDKLMEDRIFG